MADGFKPISRCSAGGVSLISSDYANQLIDLLNAIGNGIIAPAAGVGSFKSAGGQYILDLTPLDRRLKVVEGRPSGGGGLASYPMMLQQASNTEVLVAAATVGGIVPNNINTPLDVSSANSVWNVYLQAVLDVDGIPTAVDVIANTSAVPADDANTAYHLIGQANVSDGNIVTVDPMLAWSQTFVACGRNAADVDTTPGVFYWIVA